MTFLSFNDFYFFTNTFILLCVLWLLFFKSNTNSTCIESNSSTNINNIKISNNTTFLNFYVSIVFYKWVDIYFMRGKSSLIWFNHFNLNNFTINLLYFFILISFCLFTFLNVLSIKLDNTKSIDYFFSINNIILIIPYLFFINTIFTFLFLLELVSVVLLYKLISSKIWFRKTEKSHNINNNIPQNYINMIFFQFWVTFLSTIFIIYFYVCMFYMHGTTDWLIIQYLNSLECRYLNSAVTLTKMLILVFLLSIFFKLGLTPFHLFKIEIYKGLPYLSIFFYTTYYFVILFVFFVFLLSDFLFTYSTIYYLFLILLLVVGSFYVAFLMFDVNLLKAFFTYSTVLNTLGLLTVFVTIL